uniref:Piwi domain-containing protein n=1 Tax=Rodentolepis nana TaxID=102285 RepID=A0A0R3U0B3_RODNA
LDKTNKDIAFAGRQLGLHLQFTRYLSNVQVAELPICFRKLRQEGVKLAICVLPKVGPYSDIKRACEFQEFLVTQCVKDSTLGKPNAWSNILLKINGKLGGENWELDGMGGYWGKDIVMVVGADVTHPGPAKINALRKSVAAVVASISPNYMKYVAVVKQQNYQKIKETNTAREDIEDMEGIFEQLLQAFFKKNNTLPTKVIFYRDGVSEGQFKIVVSKELGAMQRACTKLRVGYQPGITFIVVQKRHHIRFLPTEKNLVNVDPGTIVDTDITHRREFDFYLCSQQGIQGTSKPAHYHVIYDDNDLGADELQMFTFYLCHVYMRCTRSVSYPAPTYYAHLAAFRGRDWMKGINNPEILLENNQFKILPEQRDLMFFL